MSLSRQEEIISALWAIASLIAFGNGFVVLGWILGIKATTDVLCAVWFAIKETIKELK